MGDTAVSRTGEQRSRTGRLVRSGVVVRVEGTSDQAFSAVREAFAANFERGEIGAACTVSVDGQVVVDIWGGWADADRRRPWARDTLVNAYSVGKPIVALALLQLVARGVSISTNQRVAFGPNWSPDNGERRCGTYCATGQVFPRFVSR